MNYFIRISYDGSKFYGFQRLNQYPTVQKCLEDALSRIDGEVVEIKGAGRTDRGVHAKGQGVHFSLHHSIPLDGLKSILNKYVAPYIHVAEIHEVSSTFHARFSVLKKVYRYRIYLGDYNPCFYDYVMFAQKDLNISVMEQASKLFLGIHNFQNFVGGERENYEAIIYDIQFLKQDNFLDIVFVGKSFYRYMVRNMVGALLDVGIGKRSILDIEQALSQFYKYNRFSTAISNGLYLDDVVYSSEDFF